MSLTLINVGVEPNDGTGDPPRTAFLTINANFEAIDQALVATLDRANHTGTQPAETIEGLAPVATSGAYGDLTGLPAIPWDGSQWSTDLGTPLKFVASLPTSANQTNLAFTFYNEAEGVGENSDYNKESHIGLLSQRNGDAYYRRYIKFGGVDANGLQSLDWYTGANPGSTFIRYDVRTPCHRLREYPNGNTELNTAPGATSFILNRALGGETYGTNGLTLYNGTTGVLWSVNGSGDASLNGAPATNKGLTVHDRSTGFRAVTINGGQFELVRNRVADNVGNNTSLGIHSFRGISSTGGEQQGALIQCFADAAWAVGSSPARVEIRTSPVGSTTPATALSVRANKNVEMYGGLIMPNLPTTNPGVAGAVWNDGGVLKISSGP